MLNPPNVGVGFGVGLNFIPKPNISKREIGIAYKNIKGVLL